MDRGLLTESQREFLRGEKDDVDEQTYRYNVRSDFRQRMDRLEEDLELLEQAGEDDLIDEFNDRFGASEFEQQLDRLEEQFEQRLAGFEQELNRLRDEQGDDE
ncbi:hypothetical protein [Halostella litorea]|uniref:hypothetical protein n=1 Tax=Halostella litorea TaxID=2528831 RepID=UPI001091F741|nr:hypothetical protein [Halostella litorea]